VPESLNRSAVLIGAVSCLVIAVPAAVVTSVLADDGSTDQSNWVFLALLAIVAAYLLGGAQAGARALDAPFLNGAAAGFAAFAVVQTVGVVLRLVRGDDISLIGIIFNGLLAASFGTVGAWFGARRAARSATPVP
jgi:putative membrane protein (TIGR04086 family)